MILSEKLFYDCRCDALVSWCIVSKFISYWWISFDDTNGHSLVHALSQPVGDGRSHDPSTDDADVVVMVETLLVELRLPFTNRTQLIGGTRELPGTIANQNMFTVIPRFTTPLIESIRSEKNALRWSMWQLWAVLCRNYFPKERGKLEVLYCYKLVWVSQQQIIINRGMTVMHANTWVTKHFIARKSLF